MTPYAIEEGYIKPEHLKAMQLADMVMALLPMAHKVEYHIRAHHVCCVWHLLTADHEMGAWFRGKYNGHHEHSWIRLQHETIIDVYPVACVRPTLICANDGSPAKKLYQGKMVDVVNLRGEDDELILIQSTALADDVYKKLKEGPQQTPLSIIRPRGARPIIDIDAARRRKRRPGRPGWGNGHQR